VEIIGDELFIVCLNNKMISHGQKSKPWPSK